MQYRRSLFVPFFLIVANTYCLAYAKRSDCPKMQWSLFAMQTYKHTYPFGCGHIDRPTFFQTLDFLDRLFCE